jgi:hypothetical protein
MAAQSADQQTSQPSNQRTDQTNRDAPYWAKPVAQLKVTDIPAGAMNLNVDGREVVGPLQGFGQLWQKTYRVRLEGCDLAPTDVVEVWKARFPEFQPPSNRFYPSLAGIKPGEVVLIDSSTPGGPVSTGVMVLYADDESFTLMTPAGHPESGWVTFAAYDTEGCTVIQVQSMARANDPIYEVAFRLLGSRLQEGIWTHVVTSLARHCGVDEPHVELYKACIDPRLQWSQVTNLRHNAQMRTVLYKVAAPLRRLRKLI